MMSMMFGWRMAFAARASFMKRSTSAAILGELAAQDLDGRLAPHERVFGQVDGAHPAFPKQYRHLVSC